MSNKKQGEKEENQAKNKIEKLQAKLKQCEEEKEEYLSGWKRAKANLLNYKKDEQTRLEKARQESKKDFILKVLPVLDSFDRAAKNDELDEGMQQIKKELLSILQQEGVKKIDTDCKFDPKLHQAVEQLPSDEEQGTIIEEITAGYKYKDQVIRAAEVKVAAEENIN